MTNSNLVSNLNYASLGRRALALFLDSMILAIPCAIGGHVVPVLGGLLVYFLYAPVLEASALRATLGKHLMGIQVVDGMGRRVSLRAAAIRNVLKFVSTALVFAGFIVALFSQRKQTLHDMLADTFVVYGRTEGSVADAWMDSLRDVVNSTGSRAARTQVSELERLQALREKGALSEEEFQEQKKKILGG